MLEQYIAVKAISLITKRLQFKCKSFNLLFNN